MSVLVASACAVLCDLGGLSAGPASAAGLSACTPHRGTIVAVDFAHWGGPIVRGCGIGQRNGYALLHAAGFRTAGDAHDGAAFICRIGNQAFRGGTMYPTPSEDSCTRTPSTSAYWSFWVAPTGQNTWTYSPIGPMGDVPKPGEVELWMFGATNVAGTHGSGVPKFPPSKLRAAKPARRKRTTPSPSTTPAPSSTSPQTTSTATKHPGSAQARARGAHRSTAKSRAATAHRQPGRPARSQPGAHGPRQQGSAGPVPVVSAQPTDARTSPGSAVPLVVGLCLALALSAGAAWTMWRRRRQE